VALAPVTKLLVAMDVGERTLAMAQRFVHHVPQVLAPDCAPLFLTDGFREYLTALLGSCTLLVIYHSGICGEAALFYPMYPST
jgi:hypothetical protein